MQDTVIKTQTPILVNRILRGEYHMCLEFHLQIEEHCFQGAQIYGMPLSQRRAPGCNQGKEGKGSYKKTLTLISCPQGSLSSVQKCLKNEVCYCLGG